MPLSMLLTCALLLRAVVVLLSGLQACERSSFIHTSFVPQAAYDSGDKESMKMFLLESGLLPPDAFSAGQA
jgi:hypothetical protein